MEENLTHTMSNARAVTAQRQFMMWVYRWMFLGLLITGLVAWLVYSNKSFLTYISQHSGVYMGLIIAELIVVFVLSFSINRMSIGGALFMFLLYSALNGLTVSVILAVYTAASVAYAFFIAALMFGIMSVYGYFTKTDLTRFGNLLSMALIGLIIAFIVNMIWFNQTVYWVVSIIGIFIFVGLTAYDTQTLKRIGQSADDLDVNYKKVGVIGALTLYLDFINIFFLLLGVSGRRS